MINADLEKGDLKRYTMNKHSWLLDAKMFELRDTAPFYKFAFNHYVILSFFIFLFLGRGEKKLNFKFSKCY